MALLASVLTLAVGGATTATAAEVETGGYVDSSPAVVDGTVYVGSDDGNVYALSEETPSSPTFQVAIDGTNEPVTEGDTLSVEATVENTGNAAGTQRVNLSVAGTERDSASVSLGPGGTNTVTLSWEASDGDAGDYTATVASANDSDSASVSVTAVGGDSETRGDQDDSTDTGGSGGGSAESDTNVRQSISLPVHDDAPEEDGLQMHFETTAVRGLSFEDGEIGGSGQIRVGDLKEPPASVAEEFGSENVVSSVDVDVPDSAADSPARIRFRLTTRELGDRDPESLQVVRVDDAENQRLPTEVTERSDGDLTAIADSPGFSSFAVVSLADEQTPSGETTTATPDPTPTADESAPTSAVTPSPEEPTTGPPTTSTRTETPDGQDGFGALVAVLAIVVAGLYARGRRG